MLSNRNKCDRKVRKTMSEYKKLKQDLIYKGRIIELYKDTVQLPNGKQVEWDFVKHKGASAIVAVDQDGKLLMVRQYRNAIDRMSLEIPAGGIDIGEKPEEAALRELQEETGYCAQNITHLIDVETAVGFTNETIYVYLATGLIEKEQNLDEDEFVTIERYEVEELLDQIIKGEIKDAKTIAAVFTYRELYGKGKK